jgi:hypothetical protein
MISHHRLISSGSVHMSRIHTITYVLFTKKSFSEPLQEFDFLLTVSQILRNSQANILVVRTMLAVNLAKLLVKPTHLANLFAALRNVLEIRELYLSFEHLSSR